MNRTIKFKLKNGKIVTIHRLGAKDYPASVIYFNKFSEDPGAIQTMQYKGQPEKDKENSIRHYQNNFVIGAFDGENMVGIASVQPQRVGHPYCGRSADIGIMLLEAYTHNGIGGKFLDILEKWARENNIHKLHAYIRHNNVPSIVNFIKHGFIITGINHDAAFINGKWLHEYTVEKILEL